MKQWRMRTTLMIALLAMSLGLTATCLLIIRVSVQQEIRRGLNSDLDRSLSTFRNIARQRNAMLAREAALLADLPSLKALMVTQDARTIQDGSKEFWRVSGTDFFALASQSGQIFTYFSKGNPLDEAAVKEEVQACLAGPDVPCMITIGTRVYVLAMQPLYFGPSANQSQFGYVVIGYAVDDQVAREVSEGAAAEVAFTIDGTVSATTLPQPKLTEFSAKAHFPINPKALHRMLRLGREQYMAVIVPLASAGQSKVQLVVLKSYDRASDYLRSVNRWIAVLGLSSLLLAGILAAYISRTVTRPLEELVAGTRALGQGDFGYQLSIDGALEVQELGLAFDRMRGELKRTQEELIETDRLATIGRMASSVSHDLRHHLSAIYANAEFMSLGDTAPIERTELLIEVKEAVQGMTDLIESLLLFSQTGQTLYPRLDSLDQLVEKTMHAVRQHPESRGVRITADLKPLEATVDARKLGRALYNLMLNACQAAKNGPGEPAVQLTLCDDVTHISIRVGDNGTGIPCDIRQTLFLPFVSAGKANGVGLGLTLAQHIAQEHGGEVTLDESSPGTTVFTIVLNKSKLRALELNQQEISTTPSTSDGLAGQTAQAKG
jgi:signal transduction histidine kinase